MNCIICKVGDTKEGKATVMLTRGETTVVIKEVPAQVCANCGEYYLSQDITAKVLDRAQKAAAAGVEIEIVKFAA